MIKPLTSMRFIAALLVFIYHYRWLDIDFSKWPLTIFWQNLINHGFIGVSFFFVLSGFVLGYAYEKKIKENKIKLSQFYKARLFRIYPLHLITLIISIPLMQSSPWNHAFYQALPLNITLLQSFIPSVDYFFSFNSPSWSISNELFFYALFPLLIIFSSKKLIFIEIALFLLLITVWISSKIFTEIENYWYWLFYINPIFRLIEFILGILIFRIKEKQLKHIFHKKTLLATTFEISIILIVFVAIYFFQLIPPFLAKGVYWGVIFSLLILVFSYETGFVSKVLSIAPLVYLGEISFSFYMLHQIIFRYLLNSSIQESIGLYPILGFFVLFSLIVALSAISFHMIEIPLHNLGKRKYTHDEV